MYDLIMTYHANTYGSIIRKKRSLQLSYQGMYIYKVMSPTPGL